MVKSRTVLNAALREQKVAALSMVNRQNDPIIWLQHHLQVSFDKDSQLLRIALLRGAPQERVVVVDEVCKAYLNAIVYKDRQKEVNRLAGLRDLCAQYDDLIRQKRNTLKTMEKNATSPKDMVDVKYLQREIEENEAIARDIRKQQQTLEVEMRAPMRIRLFETAFVDQQPPWPQSAFADFLEWLRW